jgi:hypothetical protein
MTKPEYKKRYYITVVTVAVFCTYCFFKGLIMTAQTVFNYVLELIKLIQ